MLSAHAVMALGVAYLSPEGAISDYASEVVEIRWGSRHGIVWAATLILLYDDGHLDCLEGLRLAERVLNIPSLHDPLRQEANPEPTERGAPSSEPRSSTGRPRSV